MLKKTRRLIRLLLLLLIVILAIPIALLLWADKGVQKGIETITSQTLAVPVRLDHVDLSLWKSQLSLDGLTIANPPNYQSPYLLQLQSGSVSLDLRTLRKEPLHIKELRLQGVTLMMEQRGMESNLRDILDRIPKPYEPNYPQGPQLLIDLLDITDITVHTKLSSMPGDADVITTKLAPIRMEHLGKNEEMDSAILAGKICNAFIDALLEHGIEGVSGDIHRSASEALEKITEMGRKIFDPNAFGIKF